MAISAIGYNHLQASCENRITIEEIIMAKGPVSDGELKIIAKYLSNPDCETEIHVETHPDKRVEFEREYAKRTKGYPVPTVHGGSTLYFVWGPDADKYSIQLRIVFKDLGDIPPEIEVHKGKRRATWEPREGYVRINYGALVYQLFECGFVIGKKQDSKRIKKFMSKRF